MSESSDNHEKSSDKFIDMIKFDDLEEYMYGGETARNYFQRTSFKPCHVPVDSVAEFVPTRCGDLALRFVVRLNLDFDDETIQEMKANRKNPCGKCDSIVGKYICK